MKPFTLLSGVFLVNRGGPLRSPHSRRGRDAHFDHSTAIQLRRGLRYAHHLLSSAPGPRLYATTFKIAIRLRLGDDFVTGRIRDSAKRSPRSSQQHGRPARPVQTRDKDVGKTLERSNLSSLIRPDRLGAATSAGARDGHGGRQQRHDRRAHCRRLNGGDHGSRLRFSGA